MDWHSDTSDPNTVCASSPNGWTHDELSLEWIKHFNIHTSRNRRPRLLIPDGHRSYLSIQFCEYALPHNIILFRSPAYSTHLLQPFDVGLFAPLLPYCEKEADDHLRDT
jgi:hypothetical protein